MPDLSLEHDLWRRGLRTVAGVDEAGRGPLAGPVVAAAVVLPPDLTGREDWLEVLDDSKRLNAARRELAFETVQKQALDWSVASIEPEEIDRIGIGAAALGAMMAAVDRLRLKPAHLLLDYIPVRQCPYPYDALVKGDSRSYSIAAASNVAKVVRDRLMVGHDADFPEYGFARHKGYATRSHLQRLEEIGPCDIHRRSFAPVARRPLPWPGVSRQ